MNGHPHPPPENGGSEPYVGKSGEEMDEERKQQVTS
jgi:hypothetical protein